MTAIEEASMVPIDRSEDGADHQMTEGAIDAREPPGQAGMVVAVGPTEDTAMRPGRARAVGDGARATRTTRAPRRT